MTEHGSFNDRQRGVLLQGIATDRIARRKQGSGQRGPLLSYLEQADVRAHANRMFGFGGWDCETQEVTQVFETEEGGRWNVGYRVTMRLTVRNFAGQQVACYSETAVGTPMGPMGDRGEAHDMAVKTASSDAMKRCFINLGDQFGLSLYWKGRTAPVVLTTLFEAEALPAGPPVPTDEESPESGPTPPEVEQPPAAPDTEVSQATVDAGFEMALDEIRVAAVVPDSGIRLLALAGIKGRYPEAVLNRTTTVKGSVVTLGALVDRASVGEFVPVEEPTA